MKGSLAAKIGGAMALIIVAAVSTTTLLNILRFDETYRDFVSGRLQVIASDIGRDVTFGLDLGLDLRSMDNLSAVLARHVGADDIVAVAMMDCAGNVVEGAGTLSPGASGEWRDAAPPPTWSRFSRDAVVLGLRVDNALGECAGMVAVEHSAGQYAATVRKIRLRLLAAGVAGMLVALPAFFLVRLLFRGRRHVLGAIEANIEAILEGRPDEDDGIDPHALPPGDAVERRVVSAYRAARPALVAAATPETTGGGVRG